MAGAMLFATSSHAGQKYEQNIDKTFPVTPGGRLVISADMGPIRVEAGPADKLEVHVLRKVDGGDKAGADELFSEHQVTLSQEGNTVSVVAKTRNSKSWGWHSSRRNLEVSYQITAPRQFNLELETAGGDITLGDLDGNLDARTSSGAIKAGELSGSMTAKNAGGDIVVNAAGQTFTAGTTSGAIEIKKALGTVEASDAGGDIRIAQAGSNITARTTSGSITIGSSGGDVAATDAGGDIRIAAASGNVSAQTSSGSIGIGVAKGERVKAEDQGGNIKIGHASGAVEARTTSGSIRIDLAAGPVTAEDAGGDITIQKVEKGANVRTTSGSIRIGSARGRIEARDAGGSIDVGDAGNAVDAETTSGAIDISFLTAPTENCRLAVSGGDINASVPAPAKLDVDARSMGGNVICELPITVSGHTQDGTLRGQLNGGGPKLSLYSTSGDIRIKRSAASPIGAEAEANQ